MTDHQIDVTPAQRDALAALVQRHQDAFEAPTGRGGPGTPSTTTSRLFSGHPARLWCCPTRMSSSSSTHASGKSGQVAIGRGTALPPTFAPSCP